MIHWIYIAGFIGLYFASVRFLRLYLGLDEGKNWVMTLISWTPVINTLLIFLAFLYMSYVVLREFILYYKNKNNKEE